MFVIGGIGTISSWFLMKPFGRRTLYLYGQYILFVLMVLTGILGTIPKSDAQGYATGALLIIFTFTYDITVGPVCYCELLSVYALKINADITALVAEIGSTRLRSKTVVLARNLCKSRSGLKLECS